MSPLAEIARVSRSDYYKNSDPPSSSILRISKNVIALRKKGWNVNHKRVYRLMKESVLKGRHSHKGN
ncbi:hypothetical protein B9C88_01140 [Brevibacillus laterosporus]|nr:hypothetical protein B9C88_01140 [Brevibacillus laterosporus]